MKLMIARCIAYYSDMTGAKWCRVRVIRKHKRKYEKLLKKLPEQIKAIIETRDAEDHRPLLLMAQDEGHFGRLSRPHSCWAPPGIRPLAPSQFGRFAMYVFAAVAPSRGELCSLILPRANIEMMNLFLEDVSHTFSDYFIVMQVDQAGWHCAKALVIPENMRLITQPPYSRRRSIPLNIFGRKFAKNILQSRVLFS